MALINPNRLFSDIRYVIMTRYRELHRRESHDDVWSPTMGEELMNLREFLDALDEGRVMIVARRSTR